MEDDKELSEAKQMREKAEAEYLAAESEHKKTTAKIEELKRKVCGLEVENLAQYQDVVTKRRRMRGLKDKEEDLTTKRRERTDT